MKRMIFHILFMLLGIVALVSFFTACAQKSDGNSKPSDNHTHSYANYKYNNDATCGKDGTETGKCLYCDDTNTRVSASHPATGEHQYEDGVCIVCKAPDPTSKPADEENYKIVTFNPNGGACSLDNKQFEVGKVMQGLPTPTLNGYRFKGWYDIYGDLYDTTSVMPNRDLSLTARWEKKVSTYSDSYVSLKPATSGVKSDNHRYFDVEQCVYVEITSDDLRGAVGAENNFTLRTLEGMEYNVNKGYTWNWYYDDSFTNLNGAQRFSLHYGNNLQFVTVNNSSGVTVKTYLVNIYLLHDYYVNLYRTIYDTNSYTRVRVIENELFPESTAATIVGDFEFDKRVYYNENINDYVDFNYSTAITKDWNLYQTYKPMTMQVELNGGTIDGDDEIKIAPYAPHLSLPVPQKDGYDFLGWRMDDEYYANLLGYAGANYITSATATSTLTAVFEQKKYHYTFKNDTLYTYRTVPVVTYADETMSEILEMMYVPYNTDCIVPTVTPQIENEVFYEWSVFKTENNTLVPFDFNTKITEPTALIASTVPSEYVGTTLPLNNETTFSKTGTYVVYLPTASRYVLNVTATGNVSFTVNAYGTISARSYTASSSTPANVNLDYYRYNLGTSVRSAGYVTLNITSRSGAFTINVLGVTSETDGEPIYTDTNNLAAAGEECTVDELLMSGGKSGYTFVGWYNDEQELTKERGYTFAMPAESVTYTAKWIKVTVDRNNKSAGTVTALTNTYNVGDRVTITATTNIGYTWLGWYSGEQELTKEFSYAFIMPEEDVTYTAKWVNYVLTLNKTEGGTVADNVVGEHIVSFDLNYESGAITTQTITRSTGLEYPEYPTRSGYVFAGWYSNPDCSGDPYDFSLDIISDLSLYAKWLVYSGNGIIYYNRSVQIFAGQKSEFSTSYYAFVPLVSGSVTIRAGSANLDTYAYLYDSNKSELAYGSGDHWLFEITYDVTAGTLYYLSFYGRRNVGDITVTISGSAIKDGGKSVGGNVSAEQSVTIAATTNSSYTFVGWYNGETELTKELSYSFTMPAENVTYTAKWIKVTIDRNNSSAGTVTTLTDTYNVGDSVTITATTNNGYTWVGWYNGETELTKELSYAFTMPAENVTYTAKWIKVTVDRNNASSGTVTALSDTYNVGDNVTITATTNNGYTWVGWYNGEIELTKELSYTFAMPAENVTYIAKWTYYTLTTVSNNSNAGSITTKNAVKTSAGSNVTITATTNMGYIFEGWYNEETELTKELDYTFTMPAENITYTAKWRVNEELSNFVFTSTENTLTITDVIDKSVNIIEIPNYVTNIGSNAFRNCQQLTDIKIPSSVVSIGSGAFSKCSSLESMTIPFVGGSLATRASSSSVFGYIFGTASYTGGILVEQTYSSLSYVQYYIPQSLKTVTVTGGELLYGAFSYCDGLTSIDVTQGATEVGNYAFVGCGNLTNIKIPNSVKRIGDYAFAGCTNVESIIISPLVTKIGNYAFRNCIKLTDIEIPKNVTSMYGNVFSGCDYLTIYCVIESQPSGWYSSWNSTSCPVIWDCKKNSKDINGYEYAFIDGIRYGLKEGSAVVMPQPIREIESISIPYSVEYVGNDYTITQIRYNAFRGHSSLKNITIPSGVTSIGAHAFLGCSSLTSIEIPSGVTSIGSGAFSGCVSLESMTLPFVGGSESPLTGASSSTLFGYVFGADSYDGGVSTEQYWSSSGISTYYIPLSLKNVTVNGGKMYYGAFYNCKSLLNITINKDVATIGENVFYGCSSLTIYCEVTSRPSGWNINWNSGRQVVWDYKNQQN